MEQWCFWVVSSPGTQLHSRHVAQRPCGVELAPGVTRWWWHHCPPRSGCACARRFPAVDHRGLWQAGSACTGVLPAYGKGGCRWFVSAWAVPVSLSPPTPQQIWGLRVWHSLLDELCLPCVGCSHPG